MKLTLLGRLGIAVLVIFLAWKLFLPRFGEGAIGQAFADARITPVDIMVLIALGFVALLVVLNRSPRPPAQPRSST